MDNPKIIAVYGSLKQGFWNYDRFLADQEFLGYGTVRGVMQLAPGGYPYLFKVVKMVKSRDYDVEFYLVDEDTFYSIAAMERGAGYYEDQVTCDGEENGTTLTGTIFYAPESLFDPNKDILESYTLETLKNL